MVKLKMTFKDEEIADKAFEKYRDYEEAKTAINIVLNEEYL